MKTNSGTNVCQKLKYYNESRLTVKSKTVDVRKMLKQKQQILQLRTV